MAIGTNYKKQEDLAKNQAAIGSNKAYNGMNGVSQNTANNLGNYQQGYKPSENVTRYQQQLQASEAAKPQGYNSKYAPQMESILQQITNPDKFKYEFNGDEMFKYYADLYTQKGKQASMDAMGQAAALTGGYGNSYAQQAGQQGYQQYLMNLYDRGMDLQNAAYQRYRDALGDKQNAYGLLSQADQTDYGRYRDTYGDWQNERAYQAQMAADERAFDVNQYRNDLDYWTGMAQVENQAYQNEAQRQEAIRQYNQDFAEKQRQYDTNITEERRQYDTGLAEKQRQADMDEAYRRDTLGWNMDTDARDYAEKVRQYNENMAEEQRQYDEKLAEQIRSTDLDEAYRRDTLGWQQDTDARDFSENRRQFNISNEYNYAQLAEKQREYDANLTEEQRQHNQSIALDYIKALMAAGETPSWQLLAAAGLPYQTAAAIAGGSSGGGGGQPYTGTPKGVGGDTTGDTTGNTTKGISYKDAAQQILKATINNAGNLPASTFGDLLGGRFKTVSDAAEAAEQKVEDSAANYADRTVAAGLAAGMSAGQIINKAAAEGKDLKPITGAILDKDSLATKAGGAIKTLPAETTYKNPATNWEDFLKNEFNAAVKEFNKQQKNKKND